MNLIFILIFLMNGAGTPQQPNQLIGVADLAGWAASGSATAKVPRLLSGRLEDLFDGNPSTFIRCKGEEGSAQFFFSFKRAIPIKQVGIYPAGAGVYRWRADIFEKSLGAWRPLVPWTHTKGEKRAPHPVRNNVFAQKIRIFVERLTLGSDLFLREIELYTLLELKSLKLRNLPEKPRVNCPFLLWPAAMDSMGGVLPIDAGVRWSLSSKRMAQIKGRLFVPRLPGRVTIRFFFNGLKSLDYPLSVIPPEIAPEVLKATAFTSSVAIHLKPKNKTIAAYGLYIRSDGQNSPDQPNLIGTSPIFTACDLTDEKAHHFSVAGLDQHGRPITQRSPEIRRRVEKKSTCKIKNLRVVVPIYTQGFQAKELKAIKKGFELARLFFFRNTRAGLNLDLQYVETGSSPPLENTRGLDGFFEDLRDLGILKAPFDGVHIVAKNHWANTSGFIFPNNAIGSMGASAQALYPGKDPLTDYNACWTLVHEFQHSLDFLIPDPEFLYGHFLENYPLAQGEVFDGGDYYAGQAEILRRFDAYLDIQTPTNRYLEALDSDQDGLPDLDPRLPMDERRFESDPFKPDTDQDGLTDLEEFCAGIYWGSDPMAADTDQDGISDQADPYPLSHFTGAIKKARPRLGEPLPTLLSKGLFFNPLPALKTFQVFAAWNEEGLHFCFESNLELKILMEIDGSGHLGPFESDTPIRDPDTQEAGGDVYARDWGLWTRFGDSHLFQGKRKKKGTQVLCFERNGLKCIWVTIPAKLGCGAPSCHIREGSAPGQGLTLKSGRLLGLSFTLWPLHGVKKNQTCSAYETHQFLKAVLVSE